MPSLLARGRAALASIRTRLLVANALLVVVPLAGGEFARIYERELLRSEEEGMVALARSLAAGIAAGGDVATAQAAERGGAEALGAQVRVLDPAGRVLRETAPEQVRLATRGRALRSSLEAAPTVDVTDPVPPGGTFAARPEVARALAGFDARYTRHPQGVRGVRMYVATPALREGRVTAVVYVARSTYPVLVSLYRVRNGLVRVALASLAVSAVASVFLALTISRPLRRLTEAARRIAAGERGVALRLRGHDEIATLARAFDGMSHELDARLAYISELAANVSHEFKTPLASIRGAAELLREGAADDAAARERFLGNIVDDTERLRRLVTRLLELSRVESHRDPQVPFDWREAMESLVARYVEEGRAVTLRWEAPVTHLRGSEELLASAAANLVENALRYAAEGAAVTVTVTGDQARLRTEVSDRGRGISANNLPRVWDRFFTTSRAEGGTGLGLAIVRAAVEAHGGEVGARSVEGEGSAFWFSVPRRLG